MAGPSTCMMRWQVHQLTQSKENICAAIAIIDQESGFVA